MNYQQPVKQRIHGLDILRGFAVLGILVMNIQSFSMPGAAYLNPYAYGALDSTNHAVWLTAHLFADQKFMSIFSILFGVGVLIFSQNLEAKGYNSAKWHYRRTAWLLLFGLIHGYFFWYGDILFSYALCGFYVFLLRHKSTFTLFIIGILLILAASLINASTGIAISHLPDQHLAGLQQSWAPSQAQINIELKAYTGTWIDAFSYRASDTFFMQTYVFLTTFVWRAGGMMLLGMALFKSGVFNLKFTTKQYLMTALMCFSIGFAIIIWGLLANQHHQYSVQYSMFLGSQFNYWGSILVAFGYISALLAAIKNSWLTSFTQLLSQLGRTAFSNYILQTLICTTLFYGLGYFGQFDRKEQLLTVICIWLVQIFATNLWLKRFKQGPLEQLWRYLTFYRSGITKE